MLTISTVYILQDAALDIDHTCHNIHNNTADIQVRARVTCQVSRVTCLTL